MNAPDPIPLHPDGPQGVQMFSAEAEMSVLGGMLIDPERIPDALALLDGSMFYRDAHRRLFEALRSLREDEATIDVITVTDRLRARSDLDAIGGVPYLSQVWDYAVTATNLEYHAEIIRRHAQRRRIHEAAVAVQEHVRFTADAAPEELQAEVERMIHESASLGASSGGGLELAKDHLLPLIGRLERIEETQVSEWGVQTGLRDVDDRVGVLRRGDLVIVAGRPSMGKSAFAVCNIAAEAAIRQGRRVALFSIETSRDGVVTRLIGSEGRVNMAAIHKRRRILDHEYARIGTAAGLINGAQLHIDHTPGLTLDQMRARLRDLIRAHGDVDLIVVDYLQLMRVPKARDDFQAVSEISRGLKMVAGEFNAAVVALSQLSRAVEARPDKRPMLSDLRASGGIEQDADVVMLLYRPEYYFPEGITRQRGKEKTTIDVTGRAEIILAKVRDGETGTAVCSWEKEFTHFADLRSDQ